MYIFTEEHTPAQIVKEFPKASDLFKVHGINFCCKGDIELKKTFDHKNLEGSNILTELNGAYDEWLSKGNKAINWDTKSLTDITNYIRNIIILIYKMSYPLWESLLRVSIVYMARILRI